MQKTYVETMGAGVIEEIIAILDTGHTSKGDYVIRHPGTNIWVKVGGDAMHSLLHEIDDLRRKTGSVPEAIDQLVTEYSEGKILTSHGKIVKRCPVNYMLLNEEQCRLEKMDVGGIVDE